jgi:hypothetical protein
MDHHLDFKKDFQTDVHLDIYLDVSRYLVLDIDLYRRYLHDPSSQIVPTASGAVGDQRDLVTHLRGCQGHTWAEREKQERKGEREGGGREGWMEGWRDSENE